MRVKENLFHILEINPIIAAAKDMSELERCCAIKDIRVVFVLFGDICSIQSIVQKIKGANKLAFVHVDLINGFNSKEIVIDYIARNTQADGIISTKPALIKRAQELGLMSIMRFFLLDSLALSNITKQMEFVTPDCIEILPGLMPKIIQKVSKKVKVPVIAGGLITDKEDVVQALDAGAISVSTTSPMVWEL